MTTAGEALNAEVWQQFYDKTGLEIMEGFGQTETTLSCATYTEQRQNRDPWENPVPSTMWTSLIPMAILSPAARWVKWSFERTRAFPAVSSQATTETKKVRKTVGTMTSTGTGDTAFKDDDGYYWYVGRTDDLIKSCGYRVGPFEVESVLMELPYILECAVVGIPDKNRGQIVKAIIVLTEGTEGTKALAKGNHGLCQKSYGPL